ncbi:MAG TPA: hypothetical protein VFI23_04995 [Rhizomicrobium sp.]|nr:hypothetical protein [Rhizomicrobium sp.]
MAQAFRLAGGAALVQKRAMLRRFFCLILALAAAGCAAPKSPPPAPPAPSASAIPAPPPRGEPGQYLNMPATDLQAVFGRPAFVRKDGATEMWRYDGAACRAFFFLYGAPLAVRHVETLPHGAQNAADMDCLTALRAAKL